MSEYPEDVIRVAKEALGEQWCAELGGTRGWLLRRDRIAEAIMAERERCAKAVEAGLGLTNTAIARKIRSGE